jgi:hypothetical protein
VTLHKNKILMRSIVKRSLLALFFAACSPPTENAITPEIKPFQPADLPKGPATKASQDEITPGTWVEILDLSEKDPFFQTKAKVVGRRCVVWGKGLEGDEGLYRGTVRCGKDADFFLTQATLGILKEGSIGPQSQPGKAFTEAEIPPGKQVKILGFSYEDQLFPWPKELTSRADTFLQKYGNLVGKTCEVTAESPVSVMSFLGKMDSVASSAPTSASAPVASQPASQEGPKGLVKTGEDWYGGVLLCEKQRVFVYQAWVEVL